MVNLYKYHLFVVSYEAIMAYVVKCAIQYMNFINEYGGMK